MASFERLPAEPLKRALTWAMKCHGFTWEELAERLGVTSRTLARCMQAKTIGVYSADRLAIRLGTHPVLLWPREWCANPKQAPRNGGKEMEKRGKAAPRRRRTAAA